MANLFVMVGIPGSGKSTFLKTYFRGRQDVRIVSRDAIRFSLVKPDEPYFLRENEVQQKFWREINKELAAGKDVFVDQTSISITSRKKLLKNIHGYNKCIAIFLNDSLDTNLCLKRNEKREGRAFVPPEIIKNMATQLELPSSFEGFDMIFTWSSNSKLLSLFPYPTQTLSSINPEKLLEIQEEKNE